MLTEKNLKYKSTPGQDGMILNEDEKYKICIGLDLKKITATKKIIQILFYKIYFGFSPKDINYLKRNHLFMTFFLNKYQKTLPTPDGKFLLSNLYSIMSFV